MEDFGLDSAAAARLLNQSGYYLDRRARYAEAEPLCQRALAIREKAPGPEHPDTAESLNNLALLYRNQGRYGEAEPLYQRALAIKDKALGPDHPRPPSAFATTPYSSERSAARLKPKSWKRGSRSRGDSVPRPTPRCRLQ